MYNTTKPYTKNILELIKTTWETPYVSVSNGVIRKKFSLPETSSVDGIGTKGIYHWQQKSFGNAVLDALAMNLNDLILFRAKAYKLQNHIIIPEDNKDAVLKIVKSFVEECKKRSIAIVGGETSIHNNVQGMEISVSLDGFIENPRQNKFESGDILIGFKSSGLHSNGFTKVRNIFEDDFREDFIQPTKIYSEAFLEIDKRFDIHGMMHITGGAFTKLKSLLNGLDIVVNDGHKLKPQEIFYELYNKGISDEEMYRTFNCGIGLVLGVSKKSVYGIISELNNLGFKSDIIGEVISGNGNVKIKSMFSQKELSL